MATDPACEPTVSSLQAELASLRSRRTPLAYAPLVVSIIVLLSYAAVSYSVFTHAAPPGQEELLKGVMTSLGTLASAVVFYWIGTSYGSSQKAELLAQSVPTAVVQRLIPPLERDPA